MTSRFLKASSWLPCCIIFGMAFSMLRDTVEENALHSVLTSFETLHTKDIGHHFVKRSIDSKDIRRVHFKTLGRDFHLHLQQSHEILSPGFRVLSVDKYNRKTQVNSLDVNVFKGHLIDDENSTVDAYFEQSENGEENLVATITTKDDVYVVEPSWRHLPESEEYSMISYKRSDMKLEEHLGPSYCGFVQPDSDGAAYHKRDESPSEHYNGEEAHDRYRRQSSGPVTPRKNTCALLLVADYKFFSKIGQKSLSKTTTYLINLIQRVNNIYKKTQFNNFADMGFAIKEIHIHEEWTVVAGNEDHYNMDNKQWETKRLLELFSRNPAFRGYCLAHLFTHQAFEGGVLGLAYIASPRAYSVGGICTQAYYKEGLQLFLNTGWSSSLNRYNRRLLTQEADLVTTHELGHNWGSEHDPDTKECAPGSFDGGKHIMYTYSVSGYDPNNYIFSPCSKRSIGAVLAAKSQKCFSETMAAYCGNALVEEGEECDPGPLSKGIDGDQCCSFICQLKQGAQCSDSNDECCTSCRFSSSNTLCHESQDLSCEDQSYCTGSDKKCPAPPHKRNGSECIGLGECQNGKCLSFCEKMGRFPCACDAVNTSCYWCCRDYNGTCEPQKNIDGNLVNLPEGMPCVQGYCTEQGVCEKQVLDLIERLWDIIEQLGPNTIVAFMKANIVGTVIILSLIIWIPVSCIVWRIDKSREEKDKNEIEWLRSSNHTLVNPRDESRVIRTNRIQPRKRELASVVREPIVRPAQPSSIRAYDSPNYRFVVPPHSQPTTYI